MADITYDLRNTTQRCSTLSQPEQTSQLKQTMSTTRGDRIIQPYLFFNGSCEQAVEFYRNSIGAKVEMMMRFKESPEPHAPGVVPPDFEDKIMHASVRIGETTIMVSDGCSNERTNFQGFSLSLSVTSEAEADRVFAALAEGGQVQMPLEKTFWSPRFGMVVDRFGVAWMVTVASQEQE